MSTYFDHYKSLSLYKSKRVTRYSAPTRDLSASFAASALRSACLRLHVRSPQLFKVCSAAAQWAWHGSINER